MDPADPIQGDETVNALDRAHAMAIREMARARNPDGEIEQEESTEQQAPPDWAREMRYTLLTAKAKKLGWELSVPEAGKETINLLM